MEEIWPYVGSSVAALVICTVLGWWLWPGLVYGLIILCSIFLICLILIQRGRGGGLAGAFGAAGGSSAFGTRAGDVFTRVTIVTATVWIALNMGLVIKTNVQQTRAEQSIPGSDVLPSDRSPSSSTGTPDFVPETTSTVDPPADSEG